MQRLTEFNPGVIQPGMERLIETGETLEITDVNGQVFAVRAVEGPEMMEFVKAFDNWHSLIRAKVQGPIVESAFTDMLIRFAALPARVQRELPSWKTLGVNL